MSRTVVVTLIYNRHKLIHINGRIIVELLIGNYLKGRWHALTELLSRNFPGGTEEK
jgi:hypothetical protein